MCKDSEAILLLQQLTVEGSAMIAYRTGAMLSTSCALSNFMRTNLWGHPLNKAFVALPEEGETLCSLKA